MTVLTKKNWLFITISSSAECREKFTKQHEQTVLVFWSFSEPETKFWTTNYRVFSVCKFGHLKVSFFKVETLLVREADMHFQKRRLARILRVFPQNFVFELFETWRFQKKVFFSNLIFRKYVFFTFKIFHFPFFGFLLKKIDFLK